MGGWVESGCGEERESEACHVLRRSHTRIRADRPARALTQTQRTHARPRYLIFLLVRSLKMMMHAHPRAHALAGRSGASR